MRLNFSFAQGRSFYQACIIPTSCQGPLGTSALLELILFYLLYFYFFYSLLYQIFNILGKYFVGVGALVGNFKQYVPQFSSSDTDSKNDTDDQVLKTNLYKKKKRKDRKDKVLQICCNLLDFI